MAGDREDELAQTAPATPATRPADLERTQTAIPQSKRPPKEAIDGTKLIGRYRIERELGAGGMGIVYAAFDPELERRVALKVLLSPDGDDAHKQRLLREARAMARLTHPNVVTVHEVKTADGRDYVAMELIEGESLAEWLRSEPRTEAEIVAAFVAAGRGLAAAHAAGMVHRDFKPHNVLRSKTGRIAVTDFGLAREAHVDPFLVTGVSKPPAAGTALEAKTPSTPLAGLTMTGSVLGTPAYMAPEQWSGGAVSAATDQFAFCVALWEALVGERPFRGDTIEMLKRAVELGPAALDDSKVPVRLRPIVRRGLDPAPGKRWPSMDALLAELAPVERGKPPWLALGLGGAAVVAVVVYLVASRSSSEPVGTPIAVTCRPQAVAVPMLALGERRLEAAVFQRDVDAWKVARGKACELDPALREPQLVCLDRVMARLDATVAAVGKLDKGTLPGVDVGVHLIDPAVCKGVPRLEPTTRNLAATIDFVVREAATFDPLDRATVEALIDQVKDEPCASAVAHAIGMQLPDRGLRDRMIASAERDAARCPDDRVRAEVAMGVAVYALERTTFGIPSMSKLNIAAAAVDRIAQPDLVAIIDTLRMQHAVRSEDLGDAIEYGKKGMAGYAARGRTVAQIETGLGLNQILELRGKPADLQAVRDNLASWQQLAKTSIGETHPITLKIARRIAMQQFSDGDAIGAQQKLEPLRTTRALDQTRRLTAKVVDAAGKPVAGAVVFAGASFWGAGTIAAFPSPETMLGTRNAITGADGTITFEVAKDGIVIAQLADRRSRPAMIADAVTLALEPTSHVEGKLALRGAPANRAMIAVNDPRLPPTIRYEILVPIRADGSFVIDGAPRTKLRLYAAMLGSNGRTVAVHNVDATAPVVRDLEIAVADDHSRSIDVIVRSTVNTAASAAQVWIRPGTVRSTSLDKFVFDGEAAVRFAKPPKEGAPAIAGLEPGDLVTKIVAPTGPGSACAIGLPGEIDDPDSERKIRDNLHKIEVRCVPVPPTARTVTIAVPPWPRLD